MMDLWLLFGLTAALCALLTPVFRDIPSDAALWIIQMAVQNSCWPYPFGGRVGSVRFFRDGAIVDPAHGMVFRNRKGRELDFPIRALGGFDFYLHSWSHR